MPREIPSDWRPRTYLLSPLSGASVGTGEFLVVGENLSGGWAASSDGDMLGVQIRLEADEHLELVDVSVYGNAGLVLEMSVRGAGDAYHGTFDMGRSVSEPTNLTQRLAVAPDEALSPELASYFVQFRARRLRWSEGRPIVGSIVVTTATPP